MKQRSLFLFTLLCTLTIATPSSFAGGDADISPASLLTLVRRNYDPSASVEAKFTLSIYWSVREKEEKKQGSVQLAPDDRFRAVLGSETFISNGTTVWTWNAKANQVVIRSLDDVEPALLPSTIFTTSIGSRPFREKERKNGVALFWWDGDSTAAPYAKVRIWVRVKTATIEKCELIDRNRNVFTYSFTGTVFGKRIQREAFDFVIPGNARVIDSRK